jgi:hypothetical protein
VFFKASGSRFGGFAKARFACPFRPAKSGFLTPRPPGVAAGFRWKWQTVKDLLERFRAKWRPVRVKKTRQNKNLEPRFDSIETEKALEMSAQRFCILAGELFPTRAVCVRRLSYWRRWRAHGLA